MDSIAIAQKLGILGEKVTSMTGLRIQKYIPTGTYLERHFYNFTWRISIIHGEGAYGAGPYGAGAYGAGAYGAGAYGAVRPLGPVFFANFSKLGGI